MANLVIQRATRCLQISRASRSFVVSFSSVSPKRFTPGQLHSQAPTDPAAPVPPPIRHQQARTSKTGTKIYRPIQAQEPSDPSDTKDTILATPDTRAAHVLSGGFADQPVILDEGSRQVDWSRSFHGLSAEPFPKEATETLLQPLNVEDVEVKPDGILYLPEIKYRRILNKAFGPGAWGLAPRGETIVTQRSVTREYALVVLGRLVSVARGEQEYFSPDGIPTAAEGCKSNAMMRCCKDLGVVSELWDPRFIQQYKDEHVKEVWVEHQATKKKRKMYLRKDAKVAYPYKEVPKGFGS